MIASANGNYATHAISFHKGEITELAFQDQFDLITSFFCLDWVSNQQELHHKVYRALKRGGKVLFVISTGKDDVAKTVNMVAHSEKWLPFMKDHSIPAGLYNPDDYRHFMQDAGLTIDYFEVIQIPVELPNLQSFHHFIKALPLFCHVLTEEKNDEINKDITAAFQRHCDKFYDGKIICNGEMIIATAHK